MRPLWYRNAVIYQVDPALFRDSNGDGCGDLRGITKRLDYIRGLGATAVWIMPCYESPFLDAGYDVTDHLQIAPRFGDLADMVALLEKAEELGHDNGSTLLMLVNLADRETTVEITADDLQDMVDVLADCNYDQPEGSPLKLRLGPYGYRWLRRKQQLFG